MMHTFKWAILLQLSWYCFACVGLVAAEPMSLRYQPGDGLRPDVRRALIKVCDEITKHRRLLFSQIRFDHSQNLLLPPAEFKRLITEELQRLGATFDSGAQGILLDIKADPVESNRDAMKCSFRSTSFSGRSFGTVVKTLETRNPVDLTVFKLLGKTLSDLGRDAKLRAGEFDIPAPNKTDQLFFFNFLDSLELQAHLHPEISVGNSSNLVANISLMVKEPKTTNQPAIVQATLEIRNRLGATQKISQADIVLDPANFDPLHEDPTFEELLARILGSGIPPHDPKKSIYQNQFLLVQNGVSPKVSYVVANEGLVKQTQDSNFGIQLIVNNEDHAREPTVQSQSGEQLATPYYKMEKQDTYQIVLTNNSKHLASVKLTIDGLSPFHFARGEEVSKTKSFLIEPGVSKLKGWFIVLGSKGTGAQFKVVDFPDSGRLLQKDENQIGRIAASFHHAYREDEQPDEDEEFPLSGDAATGLGRQFDQPTESVAVIAGKRRSSVTIDYGLSQK